jgi:hypothetical protein
MLIKMNVKNIRHKNIIIIIFSAIITVATGYTLPEIGIKILPSRLFTFGVFTIIVLNIIIFIVNLVSAMVSAKNIKDEKELENVLAPALQGELNKISDKTIRFFQILVIVTVGEICGSIVLIALRAFWK